MDKNCLFCQKGSDVLKADQRPTTETRKRRGGKIRQDDKRSRPIFETRTIFETQKGVVIFEVESFHSTSKRTLTF